MADGKVCVLVVDDDEAFAEAVAALLEGDGRIGVVGWASNGAEAYAQVVQRRPDVVSMDIDMPVLDGVGAVKLIAGYDATIPILLLTGSESGRVAEGLAAGASWHLPKSRASADLVDVVVRLAAGEVPPLRRL